MKGKRLQKTTRLTLNDCDGMLVCQKHEASCGVVFFSDCRKCFVVETRLLYTNRKYLIVRVLSTRVLCQINMLNESVNLQSLDLTSH